ncbi:predicted enzyme related to lactoylglutathione lyase [Longilinea arvoryzae]|uniref:Predicted enzyme related to lactoylglutathione lyase n=1 Tax=Longilinea arvoryzae TaxID=360412 RepID=A0A0S7BFF5_9CHLR|nr:VOC family protein [Longilinea arvoryzae]GAP12523.1 predicted enzyme related to lactoylglutathione lyase [Longilinea arvoryzae]
MSLFTDVNVVQYFVADWERAKKFYMDLLDWPVAYLDDRMGWMEFGEVGKTHLAINRWDQAVGPIPQNGAIAVLSVADAGATLAALRARGVRCDDIAIIPGVVAVGAFYDTEGNRIQFASPLTETSGGAGV